jgi:hypothetical protein
MASGIGFVDLAIILAGTIHLIEMKLIRTKVTGIAQLTTYMKTENRRRGWLVFFDARQLPNSARIPASITLPAGKVTVVRININPTPPSKKTENILKL